MSNIGNIIKDKRLSQNLSLDDLGELINVGKSTISKWENGTITFPSLTRGICFLMRAVLQKKRK